MKELPNMRNLMTELDNNVFIKDWYCFVENSFIKYRIYYIDHSKHVVTFTVESTEEEIRPQVLHFVERKLKEEGWVKENRLTQHQMFQKQIELEKKSDYNPADDPYYKNEDLYV